MSEMRAKLRLYKVESHTSQEDMTTPGPVVSENLWFLAVSAQDYSKTGGADENNTYAMYTPMAKLGMTVANPALLNKFHEGDVFYVDFTRAEK